MKEFKDIKALWQSENAENISDPGEIRSLMKDHQKKQSYKLLGVIAGLVVCLLLMILSVYYTPAHNGLTILGGILLVLVTLYAISFKYATWRRKKNQELLSNHDYVKELQKEKVQDFSKFPYKHFIVLIGTFTGSCLYFYPLLSKNYFHLILGYLSIILFFLFAWFVYRPVMKKKYWKKNNLLIEHIHSLKDQLK